MNNNINLKEIMESSTPVGTKKMNIKGQIKHMDVYSIPLNMLYYNDQNDRIATYISKYDSENSSIQNLSLNDYNNKIEEFIIKSDKQKFNDTMNNIKSLSQTEPGVVFIDGRVIDGNRRFTCLRKLFKETGNQSFNYFEAVILDDGISDKEIKLMELVLQHGQEGKVDYNPIEKLVGIYRDIIDKKLFTIKEYAKSIDAKESEVEKSLELARLMEEFLEYINAPKQFYIAKDLEIDGPLNEVYAIKKRTDSDEEKWEKVKVTLFDHMLMKTNNKDSGDITRIIRDYGKKIVSDDSAFDYYFEQHEPLSRKLNEKINMCDGIVNTDYIRKEIREDDALKTNMSEKLDNALYEAKRIEARKVPIELLSSINNDLQKLDLTMISKISGDDKKELYEELNRMKEKINIIEDKLNEVI